MSGNKFARVALFGDQVGVGALLKTLDHKSVVCIVCAKNRPRYHSAVADLASRAGAQALIQSEYGSKEYASFSRTFAKLNPDQIICYSYSMIIRADILHAVEYNAINVHGSLLPKNRGPNPVQWTLIRGERETGATIHFMNDVVDAGDIIAQQSVVVGATDTWVDLKGKVDAACLRLIGEYVPKFLSDDITRSPQDEKMATVNRRLNAEYPRIDFDAMDDLAIYNLIRAQVAPLPGAYIETPNEVVRLSALIPFDDIPRLRARFASGARLKQV